MPAAPQAHMDRLRLVLPGGTSTAGARWPAWWRLALRPRARCRSRGHPVAARHRPRRAAASAELLARRIVAPVRDLARTQ